MVMILKELLPSVFGLLDRVIPDKAEAARLKLQMLEAEQRGDLAALEGDIRLRLAQIQLNQAEAAAGSGRWRPRIGNVLAAALAYHYIGQPILLWGVALWAPEVQPPSIKLDEHLWELMVGMLGLAGWRTADKVAAARLT